MRIWESGWKGGRWDEREGGQQANETTCKDGRTK